MTETNRDKINMIVPARDEMAAIVRLATTALANRAGLDLDQSDDLNTAIEEVFRYFCNSCTLEDTAVEISYSFQEGKLEVSAGRTLNSLAENDTKMGRYCRFILDKVTDGYNELITDGHYTLVITKNRPS